MTSRPVAHAERAWRPMRPRDPGQSHRAATPLELFFDLVFVVAVAQAASGLHHALAAGHPAEGVLGFVLAFFGIWWAWVNFTWFASAYDVDDVPYRLLVFLQMTGALIFAAGVPDLAAQDLSVAVVGYVIMRVAMVFQWLRAGRGDPTRRTTTRRYAVGIAVVQLGWVGLAFAPAERVVWGFALLALIELAIPAWAESASRTPWHPHHIAERYGLFTIIVLGESVLAATLAIQSALDGGESLVHLLPTILGGVLILYALWWTYFDQPAHDLLTDRRSAFIWGYGHFLVLGAAAAVGAGLAVVTDAVTGHAEISRRAAGMAVSVPALLWVVVVWALHHRPRRDTTGGQVAGPVAVALLALVSWSPDPVVGTALVLTGILAWKVRQRHRAASSS